jgi:acetyl-CoA carboxylase biotin carboxylase subunit
VFRRILIANRSEIAVRVIRACRALGISPVAVYSDADRDALHVRLADAAVHLGPTPSSESYLAQKKIIAAAQATGAEAIHPGYGFLSENAKFAAAVEKAGLVWIGPSVQAMRAMGDKVTARKHAERAGVPVAPGSPVLRDAEHAAAEAGRIGYPVMLKASAGGGGIGMRVVRRAADVAREFDSARKQAKAAFGVDDVFCEKFIERPRHIEVQVLGDAHGNVVHLYERECSIQRRHQKLVEEAPSPALSDAEREEIGARAVALAKRVGYTNAGTMEFLFERGTDGAPHFYFNEMNTRLQVEHPVTEAVTRIDLVQWQLRIAAGERLDFAQQDVRLRGHAFEARVNAEDPAAGFIPSPGRIVRVALPVGEGVRVDGGVYEGCTIPDAYDSMLLKVITHGVDRAAAAHRMSAALAATRIEGVATNVPFHERLFAHPAFLAAELSTGFLEQHGFLAHGPTASDRARAAAVVAALWDAPGGGLASVLQRQRLPAVESARPGRRDWRPA